MDLTEITSKCSSTGFSSLKTNKVFVTKNTDNLVYLFIHLVGASNSKINKVLTIPAEYTYDTKVIDSPYAVAICKHVAEEEAFNYGVAMFTSETTIEFRLSNDINFKWYDDTNVEINCTFIYMGNKPV